MTGDVPIHELVDSICAAETAEEEGGLGEYDAPNSEKVIVHPSCIICVMLLAYFLLDFILFGNKILFSSGKGRNQVDFRK